jgi:hypothetical protein
MIKSTDARIVLQYLFLWMILLTTPYQMACCCFSCCNAFSINAMTTMMPVAHSDSTILAATHRTRKRRVVETASGLFLGGRLDDDDLHEKLIPPSSVSVTKTTLSSEGQANDDAEVFDGGMMFPSPILPMTKKPLLKPSQNIFLSLETVTAWWTERVERTDWWEVRSDSTLVACYVLARFLVYDLASGMKSVPGWELDDWINILSTMSSAIILAGWWTITGLVVTQSFEINSNDEGNVDNDYNNDNNNNDGEYFTRNTRSINGIALTFVNVMIASPLWLMSEQMLQFGPPGLMDQQYYPIDVYLVTGLGLASLMVLTKSTTTDWY